MVGGATTRVAPMLQEVNLACAYDTGVARGVSLKIAPRVPRALPASAFPMAVAVGASILLVQKALKEAQCFVKPTVVVKDVRFLGAQKVQRVTRRFVKVMVEVKGVRLKVDAQRACTGVLYYVLITAEERDVLYLIVPKVLGDGRIFVFVTVEGNDANMKDVERVHKAAPIFAKHMVVESNVLGASLSSVVNPLLLVINLLEVKLACVLPTVPKCKEK